MTSLGCFRPLRARSLGRFAMPLATLSLCTTCAIRLSSEPDDVECERDDDCAEFRQCSPISSRCELQAPDAVSFQFAGPFECRFSDTQYSGVNVSAAWPAFDQVGFTVPGDVTRLSHACFMAESSDPDFCPDGCVTLIFQGGRHHNASFGQIGFYVSLIVFPTDDAELGARRLQTTISSVYFCPTYPRDLDGNPHPDDPFWDGGLITEVCTQLFEIPDVGLTVTRREDDLLAGYVVAELVPAVLLPEPADE